MIKKLEKKNYSNRRDLIKFMMIKKNFSKSNMIMKNNNISFNNKNYSKCNNKG